MSSGSVFVANSNNQPVPVDIREIQAKISTSNSTVTPLSANATYTGTSELINGYGIIYVNIFADVASATDGLVIQQSSDGVNWDHDDKYTLPANTGKNYSINPYARYLRLIYTNGGTSQNYFRLQTIFKVMGKPTSHRVQDSIVDDDDAELIKSVLTGKGPDNVFRNVNVTEDGDLSISDNSSGLAIAKNDVTGTSFIHKFGAAPDFDVADGFVTVWDGADDGDIAQMNYIYSTSAAIDSISSSNSGDTGITIEIQGLDSDYDLVTQTATLDAVDAQTKVSLSTSLIRVFRLKNTSSTDLVGNVYVYEDDTTTGGKPDDLSLVRAVIENGNNQTLMAVYTIPNGYTGYMRDWYASTAGAKRDSSHTIKLLARPFGQVFQLKHISNIDVNGTSYIQHKYEEPEIFEAKTDIEMQMDTDQDIAGVSAGFDIVLVQD